LAGLAGVLFMRGVAMTDTRWAEITCTVPAAMAEDLADFMLELTGNGVSIENRTVDTFNIDDLAEETVKSVKGYLPADAGLAEILARLDAYLVASGAAVPGYLHTPPTVAILHEEDWANSWKEHFKPTRIGRRLVIKPSWENFSAENNDIVLELDPGMAFGTGTHATTRLCLEALERLIFSEQALARGEGVLDVGCGSGVLGIAAALYGADKVVAIDIDPIAIAVTTENAAINGVANVLAASEMPLAEVTGEFSLVVANILAEALVTMSGALAARVVAGGFLILSGILGEREEFVINGFAALPLALHAVTRQDEWCCIVFRKSAA
jgi:ribosomal protein L11 methyltransferase